MLSQLCSADPSAGAPWDSSAGREDPGTEQRASFAQQDPVLFWKVPFLSLILVAPLRMASEGRSEISHCPRSH